LNANTSLMQTFLRQVLSYLCRRNIVAQVSESLQSLALRRTHCDAFITNFSTRHDLLSKILVQW